MGDDMNVTYNHLYLFIPNLIPSVETQLMFNEATRNNYKISYDEWYTERRTIPEMNIQHYIGSAQTVNSPKYLGRAHQTKDGFEIPHKNNNIEIIDNLDLRKSFAEIDGQRDRRDSSTMNYEESDYIEQSKDLRLFF